MSKAIPTILVIEDEALLLKSIEAKLKLSKLNPVGIADAETGLAYLAKASPLPDMVWLDYYLKNGMNGLDFMKKAHAHPQWSKIPVIIVSNSASQAKVDEMRALGAQKYFLKAESFLGDIIQYIQQYLAANSQ